MQQPVPPVLAAAASQRLTLPALLLLALPAAAMGAAFMLTSLFLMQFASEELGVAPALVGAFFLVARLWDGVSDPLVGYLSDRTRAAMGRRRSWIAASVLPICASIVMLWAPPASLDEGAMGAWIGVAMFALYTALTMFLVPYQSLCAELSDDHHDRSRVFGAVQAAQMVGVLIAAGLGSWAVAFTEDERASMRLVAIGLAAVSMVSVVLMLVTTRERADRQGRGSHDLVRAFRDVRANPHGRIALVAFGVETLGTASVAALAPFYSKYVLEAERFLPVFLACYSIPAIAAVPVWVRLSRRFGKAKLWRIALALQAAAFVGLGMIGAGELWLGAVLVVFMSIGGSCGQVLSPSILADVVDYDELESGQRKEGAYYATYNFVRKAFYGLGAAGLGFMLQATGFEQDAPPSDAAVLGMRLLIGVAPLVGAVIGIAVLGRYRLSEDEHARVREALDQRALAATPGAADPAAAGRAALAAEDAAPVG